MLYLLNPKLWIALAIAAALSVGAWRVHSAGKASGRAEVQTKFDAYMLAAEKAEAEAKAAAAAEAEAKAAEKAAAEAELEQKAEAALAAHDDTTKSD